MVIRYKPVNVIRQSLEAKECDVCHKVYLKDDGLEWQEFIHIDTIGGYGSVFGDGDTIQLDMCQLCFKEKLGNYIRVIPEGLDGETIQQ